MMVLLHSSSESPGAGDAEVGEKGGVGHNIQIPFHGIEPKFVFAVGLFAPDIFFYKFPLIKKKGAYLFYIVFTVGLCLVVGKKIRYLCAVILSGCFQKGPPPGATGRRGQSVSNRSVRKKTEYIFLIMSISFSMCNKDCKRPTPWGFF